MDTRGTHSQSPQPSPHGAIGEFPTGIPASAATVSGVAQGHTRSSSFATRPRTPQVNPPSGATPTNPPSTSGDGDELDLNALMAHGQRQLEMDTRSRFGRFSAAAARSDSPSRWDSEWHGGARTAPSRDHSMHRQPSTTSLNGGSITPVPTGTTTNLSSFLDSSFPSPIGTGMGGAVGGVNSVGSVGVGVGGVNVPGVGRARPGFNATPAGAPSAATSASSDPSAAATHHLNALNTLLNPLIAQNDEVIRLRAEVELWRGEWQRCDRERRRLEGVLSVKNSEPINGPAFSVVLLDGDGLIFQDEFLREGFAGGQRAARALVSALPNLTATDLASGSSPNGVVQDDKDKPKRDLGTVIIQVFVNKHGLGHVLLKAGSVPSWTVYDGFWQGFTSAHDLFSVVDAGHGKEATDHKIREHLKLYSAHRQCGTVFLGASHDNSYANVLSSLETTSGLSKLVLLKGYADVAHGLKQYAGRFVTIPDLFRTSRIVVGANANPNANANATTGANAPAAPAAPAATAPLPNGTPKSPITKRRPPVLHMKKEESDDASDTETSTESSPDLTEEVEVIQWDDLVEQPRRARPRAARAARPGTAADEDDGDESKKKAGSGKKYKPAARAASVPTVRNLKPRPCHTFYLSPWGCKNGDGCEYAHNYKLNEEQTEELARLAKEIICPYVRSKRCHFSEDECVYGHRCPRGERCTFGDTCRFKDLPNGHGEETAAAAAAAKAASATSA